MLESDEIPFSLKTILEKIAIEENFENFHINFKSGSKAGDGFIGNIYRVIISGINSESKVLQNLSLICKLQKNDKLHRSTYITEDLFEREIFLYTKVLPEFAKFQEEHKIPKNIGFFSSPKCYYGNYDRTRDISFIILEDLTLKNFQMDNKIMYLDFDHVQAIFIELGKFHAISLAMKFHQPEIFEKLKVRNDLLTKLMRTEEMKPLAKRNVKLAASCLEPDEIEVRQKVLFYENCLWEEMMDYTMSDLAEPYAVINYGDCWINNIMFRYENNQISGIRLLDYQLSRYASPALDIVYFIYTSTNKGFRAKYYKKLVHIYYDALTKLLKKFKCDPENLFPFLELEKQLEKFGRVGFAMSTFTTPLNEKYPFEGDPDTETNKNFITNYKIRMSDLIRDAIIYKNL